MPRPVRRSDDAIIAHVTVTLGSPKRGCLVPPGSRYAGRIVVVDLGLGEPTEPGPRMTTDEDVRQRVPRRLPDAHKSDCGTLLVVAGAVTYVGAPGFVAEAAMRAGAGLATMAVPRAIAGHASRRSSGRRHSSRCPTMSTGRGSRCANGCIGSRRR